jgi:hypothetical protein
VKSGKVPTSAMSFVGFRVLRLGFVSLAYFAPRTRKLAAQSAVLLGIYSPDITLVFNTPLHGSCQSLNRSGRAQVLWRPAKERNHVCPSPGCTKTQQLPDCYQVATPELPALTSRPGCGFAPRHDCAGTYRPVSACGRGVPCKYSSSTMNAFDELGAMSGFRSLSDLAWRLFGVSTTLVSPDRGG